jgi:polyribonucleotide nucleotidyltransferase
MFTIHKQELDWGGRRLTLETGRIARQAAGAVLVTYGDTMVLCTVTANRKATPGVDFFPLTVQYQEKTFAAGRIPGGFFKREGRPSEKETLTSRLIDRPIRPLFPEEFRNETQVICTTLSYDGENNGDVVAMIGASAALTISGIPFLGPIGGARVGYKEGEYILNPLSSQMTGSQLDLIVAGTREGVLMVESEASELSEEIMLGAVEFGHRSFQPVIEAIVRLAEAAAKDPWDLPQPAPEKTQVRSYLEENMLANIEKAYKEPVKQLRQSSLANLRQQAVEHFKAAGIDETIVNQEFGQLEYELVRQRILETGHRIDGRDHKTVRPIVSEVGLIPKAHGSALFTRGETQVLAVATLGTGDDEQIIDALGGEYRESFMLHYNFPPFSVGEVGRLSSPGRREIGHGKLAWRAIHPVLPSKEKFPYVLRIVSEVTESNGSSSMATVCGASLSLMDAGVPLKSPVAGIAMGLIKEGARYAILSDILGDEDHLGDMDFKVAGTAQGVTALQMDLKIASITFDIMRQALSQAQAGRLHILGEMAKALQSHRDQVSANAPRIETIMVPRDKIREVIGTGGKVIREICETTGVKIDIQDDGTTSIAAVDKRSIDAALERIKAIVCEPEIGEIYQGKVVKIAEFGAFVNFLGSRDGLVHVSELALKRVQNVADVVKVGDVVRVKVIGIDERGKVKLSIKALLQEDAEPVA